MFVGLDGEISLDSYRNLYSRLEKLRAKVGELRVDDASETRGILALIDQLERDHGRSLLLLHAMVETLIRSKVITQEALQKTMTEIDALDGEADGQLDPALFRTEEELSRTPSAKLYLHRMEQAPHETTGEFLKRLENE